MIKSFNRSVSINRISSVAANLFLFSCMFTYKSKVRSDSVRYSHVRPAVLFLPISLYPHWTCLLFLLSVAFIIYCEHTYPFIFFIKTPPVALIIYCEHTYSFIFSLKTPPSEQDPSSFTSPIRVKVGLLTLYIRANTYLSFIYSYQLSHSWGIKRKLTRSFVT